VTNASLRNALELRLARFRLSALEAVSLRADFQLVVSDCVFTKSVHLTNALVKYKGVPGIYFWLLRRGETEYKIYVGHTTSLSYRLTNYISEFQPHAPNDYKLRIFHAFIAETWPTAGLDLHFAAKKFGKVGLAEVRTQLTGAENAALAQYKPILLNSRARATVEAKDELREAFTSYYRSAFQASLNALPAESDGRES
jgi:hypothetical protein